MVEIDSLPENSSAHASWDIQSVPQVKDGMLYFETRTDFEAVADYLIDSQEDDGLNEFEAKLTPFSSLRTEFNELVNQIQYSDSDILEVDRIVEDPVFETLLNQDGIIQIADTVYQVTREYVYSTHIDDALIPGKKTRLRSAEYLENQVTLSSTAPLVKYEIDRVTDVLANPGKNMGVMGRGECWVYWGEADGLSRKRKYDYRMKGSIWINNWGIYRSAGTELESQKKRRKWYGRWRHHSATEIELTGNYATRKKNERSETTYVSWSKSNAAEIRKTLLKDREKVYIEIDIYMTHMLYHDFGDGVELNGSCYGIRDWAAPLDTD